jgi:hypothetical protein
MISVSVEFLTSEAEKSSLASIFAAYGIEAEVKADRPPPWFGPNPYIVIVAAPVLYLALAFARGAAEKAGADSWDAYRDGGWRGLRRLIRELEWSRDRHPESMGTLVIEDPEHDVALHLSSRIPDRAMRELADLDWMALKGGELFWDDKGWHHAPQQDGY